MGIRKKQLCSRTSGVWTWAKINEGSKVPSFLPRVNNLSVYWRLFFFPSLNSDTKQKLEGPDVCACMCVCVWMSATFFPPTLGLRSHPPRSLLLHISHFLGLFSVLQFFIFFLPLSFWPNCSSKLEVWPPTCTRNACCSRLILDCSFSFWVIRRGMWTDCVF